MSKIDRPVFVFCLHRSGSTYLKNILDASDELKMLEDEVHFEHPHFFNTFKKYYQKYCNNKPANVDRFLTIISENKIRGAFWDYYKKKYGSFHSCKKHLPNQNKITVWDAFNSILIQVIEDSGKKRVGIKYPAHHTFFHNLKKVYPDAKNIFLVRDPRAIIASKLISPSNNRLKNKGKFKYEVMRLVTVLYFIIEFRSFAKAVTVHKKDICVIRYENLVISRNRTLKKLCDFAEINLRIDMCSATGKDSGYGITSDPMSRLNRWVTVLRRYEKILIEYFTKNYRNTMDYE
ncbi:hypothetical protein DO021_12825 [Desulfobacter hydrogenophilus]|uniref:Sulfotransferase n=1 Tax=Desulfobacter hydrogenophilus TaxID=2291 RepID=A0A328FF30_9BACT|nr:sulfotransferase [Desulfobacter hydrogenophilus]NDY74102.1 sulfotransferase [Desulfobacter hydrogenophilus]QBH14094.1 sulfotransferase [Desulfobacter hydrogenophilus]RAM01655.1 hypothetical protein DO021_12825 [Desulfobacter hydrogenophilus]